MTMSPMRDPSLPPGPSGQHHARYEDDDVDIGRRRDRGRDRAYENPTSAGLAGFFAAAISLGLLVIVLVLYIFLKQEDQQAPNLERTRWMMYWFLALDVLSFFGGLTATILGARGSSPSNPLYRGFSVTALVLGIIELILTVVLGFVMTCAVMLVEIMRAGG